MLHGARSVFAREAPKGRRAKFPLEYKYPDLAVVRPRPARHRRPRADRARAGRRRVATRMAEWWDRVSEARPELADDERRTELAPQAVSAAESLRQKAELTSAGRALVNAIEHRGRTLALS